MKALKILDNNAFAISSLVKVDLMNSFEKSKMENPKETKFSYFNKLASRAQLSYKYFDRVADGTVQNINIDNLIQVYGAIYSLNDIGEIIDRAPTWFKKHISNNYTNQIELSTTSKNIKDKRANEYLLSNSLAMKIYIFVSTYGETISAISTKYGTDGYDEMIRLVEEKLLIIKKDNIVIWNPERAVMFNTNFLTTMSSSLSKNFYRHDMDSIKGENFIEAKVTNVTPQAYVEILKKTAEFSKYIESKILEDDKNNEAGLQTVKFFYTSTVDKLK